MRFFIDASLPRATAQLLSEFGHEATDVRDIGLTTASDEQVAARAKATKIVLITADFDFADIHVYPPDEYAGIVVIDRPEDSRVAQVLELIRRLLLSADVMEKLPGRLVIVDQRARSRTANLAPLNSGEASARTQAPSGAGLTVPAFSTFVRTDATLAVTRLGWETLE